MIKCYTHILFLVVMLQLWGCSYRLHDGGGKTISIVVDNKSFGLNMAPLVDREIRKALIKSGNQVVINKNNAEWNLGITITDHRHSPQSYDPDDSILAASFLLESTVNVAWDNKSQNLTHKESFTVDAFTLRPNTRALPVDDQSRQSLAQQIANEISLSARRLP